MKKNGVMIISKEIPDLCEERRKRMNNKKTLIKNLKRGIPLYIMLLLPLLWYALFYYKPLGALQIAFKNYNPLVGVAKSPWVGFKHFKSFFTGPYAWRVIRNTFMINIISLATIFPLTILFALFINEIPNKFVKSGVQTAVYMPHFISSVIVAGLVVSFLSPSAGIINIILEKFGFARQYFLTKPEYFRAIYVTMGGWQGIGFGTIIYTSAISTIDSSLYEAATIDGAGRFKQMWHITLAGILPTIILMLIMRLGNMLSVGYETIILLYQPSTYETADVINTFVYRRGLVKSDYSFSTAVSMFNGVVSLILVVAANAISKKVSDTSLW